jgi:hypothetical protein
MEWFASHPERWSVMGAASLEKVHPHSLDFILRRYEMLYEKLLLNAPPPDPLPDPLRESKVS